MKNILLNSSFLTFAGALLLPVYSVQASEEGESFSLEEIVVSARKRNESLQDVPVSVSAYSASDIESKSITSLKELGQFTPNFSFSNNGQAGNSGSVVFIRGIGQADPNVFWDPGVGIYIDSVFMGRMQGVDLDLMDLERVEVLRGPQGTLFGKNTIGGAVNIVTGRPDNELSANAELTFGQYDRIDGKVGINLPLIEDKLAMSVAGSTRNRNGFGVRIDKDTGQKIDEMGDRNRLNGRVKVALKASENLDVLFSFDASRIREKGSVRDLVAIGTPTLVGVLNSIFDPDYNAASFINTDRFVSYANGSNSNDLDAWGTSLTLDWDLGDVALKSISAYRDTEAKNGTDPDGSFYTLIDLQQTVDQTQFSQELQLSGSSFEDRFNWVAGVYYFAESVSSNEVLGVYGDLYPVIGLDLSFTRNIWVDTKSYAAYGQGTFDLTNALSITAGLRYSDEKKTVARERLAHVTGGVLAPKGEKEAKFNALSPRFSLDYRWSEDVMTYASVARGFKSGGLNGDSFNDFTFSTFKPEFVWTYEVGLRSEFLDRRVQFNATAFYSDYTDIQFTVRRGDPDTGQSVALVENAGKAKMQGFEAEFVAMPAKGLVVSASLGHIDAEYTEVDPILPITTDTEFVKTPRWTVTLSGEYTILAGDVGDIKIHADWAHKSATEHDILNSPSGSQEAYSILNARLSFESADGQWGIAVFGTNLTNANYIMAVTDFTASLGFAEVQWARPREWGVSVKYNF